MSPLHADGRHSLAMPSFSCTISLIARRNRHCRRALPSPPKVPQHSQSENARKEGAPMRTRNHQKGKKTKRTVPTRRSPDLDHATTEGVVRAPSALGTMTGLPPSMAATAELVVPRSMPTTCEKGKRLGRSFFFFFEGEQLAVTRTFQMLRSSASRPRSAGAAMPPPLRPRVRGRQNRAPRTRGDGESARRSGEEGERKAKNQKTTAAQRRRRHQAEVLSHLLCARGDAAAARDPAHGGRNGPDAAGSAADGGGGAQGAALKGCHCWDERKKGC